MKTKHIAISFTTLAILAGVWLFSNHKISEKILIKINNIVQDFPHDELVDLTRKSKENLIRFNDGTLDGIHYQKESLGLWQLNKSEKSGNEKIICETNCDEVENYFARIKRIHDLGAKRVVRLPEGIMKIMIEPTLWLGSCELRDMDFHRHQLFNMGILKNGWCLFLDE